ncbi:MAG: SDR family oxidoreductase [Niameybacter sp.]|uniref:SDR family NAD(P)-dependent oxidoreductase n=1 Tax=Niameybacter sp. TaxID=2033640 RepID=UPI002FC89341
MRKTALITGATSGIGRAYASALAARGYHLILTGRRRQVLEEVAHTLSQTYHVLVTVCIVDFKDTLSFNRFVNFVKTQDTLEILVNNAGYGLEKSFLEDALDTQLEMLQVHVIASITLCHIVANQLKASKRKGAIINVCSLAAFTPLPSSGMYCGTKHFLIQFSESLAMELIPYGIRVQALCPGFVHTDFHSRLAIPKEACKNIGIVTWMGAEEVVYASLQGLHRNQVFLIPGFLNQVCYQLLKGMPRQIYFKIVSRYNRIFTPK